MLHCKIYYLYYKGSSTDTDFGSAGVAIGRALDGITFLVIVFSLVLSVLYCVKHLRRRKNYNIGGGSYFSRPNEGLAKYKIQFIKCITTSKRN